MTEIEKILARLQAKADAGPSLFTISREDARRIVEHVRELKANAKSLREGDALVSNGPMVTSA